MKKLIVVFFVLLIAFAEWQQREGLTLPKGIQISDVKVSIDGSVWVLTKSSLSQVDFAKKSLNLFSEIKEGKLFAVCGENFFIIDNTNKLSILSSEGEISGFSLNLINPIQIEALKLDRKTLLVISEPNRIILTDGNEIINNLITNVEKFSIPARLDENAEINIYVMNNNQIYAWTGRELKNPSGFKNRLFYSASEKILDFATGIDGRNYILFKDSILVLKQSGEREDKILIENNSPDLRIYVYPGDNSLLLFNRNEKTLKILSRPRQQNNEIMILNKNRPNPVDNYTEFEFTLNEPMYITFTIYNLIGKPVKVLASGFYNKGTHTIPWYADDEKGMLVPNGVYFYRLEAKKGVLIKQLIVLR
uniref:T9SS type A sorting domain-containing protein n=1 Tax=candidate division WOR-3 bacterium TaxID=2052148 RepID=A0A7C6AER3_UNCW3